MADKKKKDDKKEKEKDEAEKAPAKDTGKDAAKEGDAPAAEGEAAPEEGGKKKLPMKLIIIAGAGAVVVIIIIVVVLVFVVGGKKPAPADAAPPAGGADKTAAASAGEAKGGDAKKDTAIFYDLGEMVVNLNTDGKRQTFLKLVVQLELENAADKPVIDNLKPRIVDNFQTYLRELRVDDLRGSAGLYRLREELLFRVSEAVHPVKIRDVLFQQMLVQ